MDLYIQIGVLLLFLTALSLFIYVYTGPAQMFTQGINETNESISKSLEDMKDQQVSVLNNNINASGSEVLSIVKAAESKNLAVFVQTRNQQGLVVNYGYQLRPNNAKTVKMDFSSSIDGVPNDFEASFVTNVGSLFGATAAGGAVSVKAGFSLADSLIENIIKPPSPTAAPLIRKADSEDSIPSLALFDTTRKVADSKELGRTYTGTGVFFTNQVLKKNMPTNNNISMATKEGSNYFISPDSNFYSVLVTDANTKVIAIYIEEHGVDDSRKHNVLARAMIESGLITATY